MPVYVHPTSRSLILPHEYAKKVRWLNHFEQARWLTWRGSKMLALPHNLSTAWKLANDGISVPGPIQYYYDWPGRVRPFEKQKQTADFLTLHRRAYCFNEIGTGKSLSALWALDYMRREGALTDRVLILSPLSTLERVWGDEIWRNFPQYRYGVVYGTRDQRERILQEDFDYYILNHDGIKVFADIVRDGRYRKVKLAPLFEEFLRGIGIIVVDEGAVFRNKNTDLWLVLREIVKSKGIWWLTGSPMPHAPTDIWAQAKIVTPQLVPAYFGRFRDQVMYKVTQFKWLPKPGWERTVYSMIRPVVRFRRDEMTDLPPRIVETREAALSSEQSKVIKELLREFYLELKEGRLTVANEGVRRQKLLQAYSGAVYLDGGRAKSLSPAARLATLGEVLDEVGGKVIVFAPYEHNIQLLESYIAKQGYSVGVVTGSVSATQRNEIFRAFQEGDLQVLLANPGTMAHGLTLTASHVVVWWSPIDDYEIYEQANGRITRPGQKHEQVIVHIQATDSKLEAEAYRRLAKKESMQGLLLTLLEGLHREGGNRIKSDI